MKRTGWKEDELEIIKKYYPAEGIAVKKRLKNRTDSQIYGVAWHYGIKNENRKKRENNTFPMKRYTEEELGYIKENIDEMGAEVIAEELGRTVNAVRSAASKYQLSGEEKRVQMPWTEEEIGIVRKYFPKEGIAVKNRLPDRTVAAIYSEASHIGVAKRKRTRKSSNSVWTKEEENIIKEYYLKEGVAKCEELLPERSRQAIIVRANRYLGIKK